MFISFLIFIIGIIPIVLGYSLFKLYKGAKMTIPIFIYMMLISFWQVDISVLYLKDIASEQTVLFLFKLFRGATIYAIPATFFVIYTIIHKHEATLKENSFMNKIILNIFTRQGLIGLLIWSSVVYLISWTHYGVQALEVKSISHSPFDFYFPVYGSLGYIYKIHISSLVLLLFLVYIISKRIHNFHLRQFSSSFSVCSVFVFVPGVLNFLPETGVLISSAGVVVFSTLIMLAFVRMHHHKVIQLHQSIERQKKLDYTGNLAASLIHEAKNCTTIIKGYTKLLQSTEQEQKYNSSYLSFIELAANQLDEISTSYKEYIKHHTFTFEMENLNDIIEKSIQLSQEIAHQHGAVIEFSKKYHQLGAYVNKSYLSQVLINLMKNGMESIPDDRINKKIRIETNITNELIHVDVHDTGKGIPLSDWDTIFDPFASSKKDGMGIGLPFCKKIIFEHRGDLNIIHSDENGTIFRITLPQYEFTDIIQMKEDTL